jgi:hypothetical protein
MGRPTHLYNAQDLPLKMGRGAVIGRTIRGAQ